MDIYEFMLISDEKYLIHEREFMNWVKQHRRMLYTYGIRIINNSFIIENIIQDAFLKLWNFKETITSEEHAERFLMQSVRWACYAYFRQPVSRFHRHMIELDTYENYNDFLDGTLENETFADTEDDLNECRLKDIREAIDKVCQGREKEVMKLHYIRGLRHGQIAERYHISVSVVTIILEKGLLRLKALLVTAREQKPTPDHDRISGFLQSLENIDGLSAEQNAIYQLKSAGRYSFDQISSFLQMPLAYVQLEYIKAWKVTGCQNKKRVKPATRWKGGSDTRRQLLSA